jgi:hypothetical protein
MILDHMKEESMIADERMIADGLENQSLKPAHDMHLLSPNSIQECLAAFLQFKFIESEGKVLARTGNRGMGRTGALQFPLLQYPELPYSPIYAPPTPTTPSCHQ